MCIKLTYDTKQLSIPSLPHCTLELSWGLRCEAASWGTRIAVDLVSIDQVANISPSELFGAVENLCVEAFFLIGGFLKSFFLNVVVDLITSSLAPFQFFFVTCSILVQQVDLQLHLPHKVWLSSTVRNVAQVGVFACLVFSERWHAKILKELHCNSIST